MNKVKKMLCIVLALMMIVVPMSVCAAPADGYRVAMHLSADNTTVAPGDTITFSLTVDVDDFSSLWGLPCFYLMYNDSVFAPASDFKTNKTSLRMPMGDFGEYVVPENGINNTITSSNYTAVKNKFATSGESATDYTGGVMMTFSVNNDAGYTTAGGINYTDADTVQIEFYLNVAEDAALGTYKVGLPKAAYLANKAYFNCCDTGKAVRVAASAIDVSDAFVEITVAENAGPELVLDALTQQIRFPQGKETFDYRVFADVTNLEEIFTDVAGVNDDSDNTYATEAGFIYNVGGAIDENTALDQINGGEAVYVQQKHAYISTSTGLADYAMACVIYDIPYDAANETLSVLAYIKYVQDGEAKVALVDAYTGTFEPLFSKHNPNA